MVDALILAGGETSESLHELSGETYEAFITIDGRPMVTYVADILANSPCVERIFIVGPRAELSHCNFPENSILIQGGKSLLETIQIGMAAVDQAKKTLVLTCDIPLITEAAVRHFLQSCQKNEADFYYPIVEKECSEHCYPGNERTYVRLKEGAFTGGNIFLVNPRIVPACLKQAEYILENRKKPFKLCQFLGILFVLQFLFGKLKLKTVERRVSQLLHIRGAVIQSPFAEVGLDVDKPSDLMLVRNFLE